MSRGKNKAAEEAEANRIANEAILPTAPPEPSPVAASKPPAKTGKLAMARQACAKIVKKPESNWRVILDYDQLQRPLPHIPTGSLIIDYLIGGDPNKYEVRPCPGLPRGRVTQLWGHESSGKTTLALTAAAQCIRDGGTVLYVDWENDIVPDYASALGIPISDDTKFELVQPDTLEDGIKIATTYATAGVDLVIFDSVGAATPARIANRELTDIAEQAKVGELQQVWSQELCNLKRVIAKSKTAVLGISQVRAKISTGPSHGGPTTQPQGGNAWKFYSSIRLELRRIKAETSKLYNPITHKTDARVSGGTILCKVIKCKLSKSQGREEVFYISHGDGIDDIRSVMEIGAAHGFIKKAGSWLSWTSPEGEEIRRQGSGQFREYLKEHPDHVQALYRQVLPALGSSTYVEADYEEEDLTGVDELVGEVLAEELKEGPDLSEPDGESEPDSD